MGEKWEFRDEDFMNSPSILNKFLWCFFPIKTDTGKGINQPLDLGE